jgi:hypothetical protein
MSAEVLPCVTSFLASATLIPLDKLDPEQRHAREQELCDQKGTMCPIGIGSVLVRFANRALLALIGDETSQWSAARHQFGVGVSGGVEIVQVIVRAALDASPDYINALRGVFGYPECEIYPKSQRNIFVNHRRYHSPLIFSISSCGVPCLRTCKQIPRFDRLSPSLR